MRRQSHNNAIGVSRASLRPGFSWSVFSSGSTSSSVTVKPHSVSVVWYASTERRATGRRSPSALGIAKSPRPKSVSTPRFARPYTNAGCTTVASSWPLGDQYAVAFLRGKAKRSQRQLVEEHRRQNQIKAAIREWQGILYVEGEILGVLDGKCDRAISTSACAWSLMMSRAGVWPESAEHERRKVAVSCAQLQDGPPLDIPNPVEQQLVEDIALECAAVIASDAMPLLRDAVVICRARYSRLSFRWNDSAQRDDRWHAKAYHRNCAAFQRQDAA